MMTPDEQTATTQLARVVHKLDPTATLRRAWPLAGGVSAQMTALEITLTDGGVRRVVLRRSGEWTRRAHADALAHEAAVLRTVRAVGIPAPEPLLLDATGELLPDPYLLLSYAEGAPPLAPAQATDVALAVAGQLATLHRASIDLAQVAFLPRRGAALPSSPAILDDSLDEARILAALTTAWPPPAATPVLLHGDCWPGNLIWQGGKLAAIIDWEDAAIGPPLLDLAVSRLDMLWIFGPAAMHTLTRRYADLTGSDLAALAVWDLWAALRPCGYLADWAATWPGLGRPDITVASMTAAHAQFVAQALAGLPRGGS